MKTTHLIHWIRIALLSLALALVVILLTIPLLAKAISQREGNPIEPEKLDIRPIPVPVPPSPLVSKASNASATSSPSLLTAAAAPRAIAVPTPPVSTQKQASLVQPARWESSIVFTIPFVNRQGVMMALIFLILLNWGWLHRTPHFPSLPKECA